MDKLKTYLVEVVINKIGPKVAASVLAYGVTLIVAHQEFLEQMGITYYPMFDGTWSGGIMPTGSLIVIEFDTLKVWGAGMIVAGVMAFVAWMQHHGTAVMTGAPQSGDLRQEPSIPTPGGDRKDDPPKAA